GAGPSSARVRLCLFGNPRILIDGVDVERFETRRSLLILARLAISRRRCLTRSELAESLWPGDFFDATRLRLRQELSRLRRALGECGDLVIADGENLLLDREAFVADTEEFERNLKIVSAEIDSQRKERLLTSALELSGNSFLEGYE